ncbi:MAG: hypothetical protein ACI4RD_08365 [Kiritimatiellia bacterium]
MKMQNLRSSAVSVVLLSLSVFSHAPALALEGGNSGASSTGSGSLSADVATLVTDKFGEVVGRTVADEGLAQMVTEAVKTKIDEALQKGEKWVEDGGIRKTVQEQLEKQLDGKVSDADKQRILNLADTLCNVGADGGVSFVQTLGSDGKDLAVSLAVKEIERQISSALPKDVADNVNAMVEVLAATGNVNDPSVRAEMINAIQSAVSEYVPYANSATTINDLVRQIADGQAVDVMTAAKDLGKSIGVDALKEAVSANLDKAAAERVNALIDAYTKDGVGGLTDAAIAEIVAAIDKYAPGTDSSNALKDVVGKLKDGTIQASDLKKAATALGVDGTKKLIDSSNLTDEQKNAAKEAVDAIAENGWSGLTDCVQEYIRQNVTDRLGQEAGDAVANIFEAVVNPGVDVWDALNTNAPIIGKALVDTALVRVEQWTADQLDRLIAKNPFIAELFGRLGIDGSGIVAGVKNIWNVLSTKDMAEAFAELSQMAVDFLKDIAAKLIDWGVEALMNWANSIIGKVIDWLAQMIGNAAQAVGDVPAIRSALQKLQCALCAAKTNGTLTVSACGVGSNVVNWIEGKVNSKKKTEGKIDK